MRYDAILFDFDFTLGDSSEGIIFCVNDALGKMGLASASEEAIRKVIGLSLAESYRTLTGDADPGKTARFSELFIEAADHKMTLTAELYPYSLKILKAFRRDGIKTGVITTKYLRRITEILDKYNVPGIVDIIVGGDSVKNPKPNPEGLLMAARKLNVPVSKCLYIGDSEVDAKAAMSAGMHFVGVLTGNTGEDILSKYPHVAVIDSLETLPDVLM